MNPRKSAAGRALLLEKLTIVWSGIEAIVALLSGIMAGSFALVAFGADSGVEVMSALLVMVRLQALVRGEQPDTDKEHRSHRILAVLFFVLAAYVVASALFGLLNSNHPSESILGLTITVAAAIAMPSLAFAKRRVSLVLTAAGSTSVGRLLKTDAAETALCGWLSVSTLIGVVLGSWVGWWWADPVMSLAVVVLAVGEGREAWACDLD